MVSKYRTGVRIIGGKWKGRRIPVPDVPGLRPTSDRIRETLFNWLQPNVAGAACLDLFAGSGALGLEALSRNATSVLAVDSQRRCIDGLAQVCVLLGTESLQTRHDRAERVLSKPADTRFDIVFIDPPFDLLIYDRVFELLQQNAWLATDAVIYVESAVGIELKYPDRWSLLKHNQVGNVNCDLLQRLDC